jgi:hypothetical protein
MPFLKTLPHHWKPTDFDLSESRLREPILHIARTVCLLESRCDDYAAYLRAIVREREPEWRNAIDQWNTEECQHGEVLRRLCQRADADFRFDAFMTQYGLLVSYHAPTGKSVRGSVGAEMVSRCVVEALASTLYRVLADATEDPGCRRVFSALAQDEARHFGMFLKMLHAEAESVRGLGFWARLGHSLRRMLDLEDDQIMVASCVVRQRADASSHLRHEANWYLGQLYGLYRWKHLRYAAPMLLRTVNVRPTRPMAVLCTSLLWCAVRLRWLWARLFA